MSNGSYGHRRIDAPNSLDIRFHPIQERSQRFSFCVSPTHHLEDPADERKDVRIVAVELQ